MDELLEEALSVLSMLEEHEEIYQLILALAIVIANTTDAESLQELMDELRAALDRALEELEGSGNIYDPEVAHPHFDPTPEYQKADDYVEPGHGFDNWTAEHFDNGDDIDTTES